MGRSYVWMISRQPRPLHFWMTVLSSSQHVQQARLLPRGCSWLNRTEIRAEMNGSRIEQFPTVARKRGVLLSAFNARPCSLPAKYAVLWGATFRRVTPLCPWSSHCDDSHIIVSDRSVLCSDRLNGLQIGCSMLREGA